MIPHRKMGDFVVAGELDKCLCGHDYLDHATPDEDDLHARCKKRTCGCPDFVDEDPDADYDPQVGGAWDDEE